MPQKSVQLDKTPTSDDVADMPHIFQYNFTASENLDRCLSAILPEGHRRNF